MTWMNTYTLQESYDVITYPFPNVRQTMMVKGHPLGSKSYVDVVPDTGLSKLSAFGRQ